MLQTIIKFYELAQEALNAGTSVNDIRQSPLVYRISRMKDIPNEEFEDRIKELWSEMESSLTARKGGA